MNQDQYNLTSACILTAAGLVHLNRVVNDLDFIIGSYDLPMEFSLFAVLILVIMSFNGFKLLFKNKSNPYTHSFLNLPEHENGGSL